MKRRSFLQSVPVAVGGITVTAYGSSPLLEALSTSLSDTDRVLIIVQLNGGNDGLNTLIPLDQYASLTLSNIRQNILIPEDKVLKLGGTNDATGLHPSMNRMYDLYNNGKLSIIQGVGYPKFNYSHFRATDIWMSGSDSDKYVFSGWAGRYLGYEYPNYPVGFPNSVMPDPIAIRIGGNVLGLENQGVPMAVSITNTNDPLNLTGSLFQDAPGNNYMGKEIAFIREVQRQTDKFGDSVKAAADLGKNVSSLYPKASSDPGYLLGTQMAIVAKLISGGIKTRIFWVNTGGFDTHSAQVNSTDHTAGTHANLLKGVSDVIGAFMDDAKLQGFEERIMGMTFSEFGRRIISNASGGTDHGAAQPMFIFGSKVVGGVLGKNPTIDPASTVNSNLPMQYDFRSVYASILGDWFCVEDAALDQILLKNFQKLPIVAPGSCIPTSVHEQNKELGENLVYAYPNPFVQSTKIKFETYGGHTMIQIINNEGSVIKTLVDKELQAGKYDVACDLEDAAAGIYYVRIQNKTLQQVKTLMKVNG
jgi:uncharacterized protein (DUF1501 family)